MKIRPLLSALAATSGLLFAALPGQASAASSHNVSQSQIDAVKAGESSNDVINTLGQPENTTKWMDGTHSLVYETNDTFEGIQHVYVDMNSSDQVVGVEVIQQQ
jgi:outer membrane protein assembly factor BamE (lipoprotein component of BamABCDE complex)